MANTATETALKVADEVWIATALLHREHPEVPDFAVEEIVQRAQQEGLHTPLWPRVYVHVIQHCVANMPRIRGVIVFFEPAQAAAASLAKAIHTIRPRRQEDRPDVKTPLSIQRPSKLVPRLVLDRD